MQDHNHQKEVLVGPVSRVSVAMGKVAMFQGAVVLILAPLIGAAAHLPLFAPPFYGAAVLQSVYLLLNNLVFRSYELAGTDADRQPHTEWGRANRNKSR
jgi:hypothetical protein